MTEEKKSMVPKLRFPGFTATWEQRKLGDAINIGSGRDYKHLGEGNIPVYGTGGYLTSVDQALSSEKDAVGIGRKGTINSPYILKAPFWTVDTLFFCLPKPGVDLNFLFCLFQRVDWKKKDESTGVPSLSKRTIENTEIPFCSIEEQRKIGTFFDSLEKTITLHQRKLEGLSKLQKSLLQKMFPKNGSLEPELRFPGFTGDWEQRKLGYMTEITSASRVHKNEWRKEGVPFLRSSDVVSHFLAKTNEKAYISPELFEKLTKKSGKLSKGDLLITGGGTIGIPYLIESDAPLYTKDADLLWVKNTRFLNSNFLYYFFCSPSFRSNLKKISHTGTISHYTVVQLKNTEVFFGTTEEQEKIGSFFAQLDVAITLHQRKLESLKKLKKSLLQQMFV